MTDLPTDGRELVSTATDDGRIRLELRPQTIAPLGEDEVLIRVEATPVNPSDMGLLYSIADPTTARRDGDALTLDIPEKWRRAVAGRLGQAMPVGNEGAGTVVAAGSSPAAQALVGRVVATFGGAMYRSYRTARASDCLVLPEGASAIEGASLTVNPLTAMAMVGQMRRDGKASLIHTAAASNLGQMLVRYTQSEAVPLVNIVRSPAQVELLRGLGATHVIDTSADGWNEALVDALVETDATLAFDAIGGGRLAGQLLAAMEAAQVRKGAAYSVYGTNVWKQVYIYGALDTGPTEFTRNFGLQWGISGFLLTPYLMKAGAEEVTAMRERVVAERATTFASHYTRTVSLSDMLDPEVTQAAAAKSTGAKLLIDPSRG